MINFSKVYLLFFLSFITTNKLYSQYLFENTNLIKELDTSNYERILISVNKDLDYCSLQQLIQAYYHKIADESYKQKNYNQALFYVQKEDSILHSSTCFRKKEFNENLYLNGRINYRLNNNLKAVFLLKKATINNDSSAKIFSFIAYIFRKRGELGLAEKYYQKAINTYNKEGNFNGEVKEKTRLARVYLDYRDLEHYKEGIDLLEELLNMPQKDKIDIRILYIIYNSLGSLCNSNLKLENSEFYYKKAIGIGYVLKDSLKISSSLYNLAEVYRNIRNKTIDLDKSSSFYTESLKYSSRFSIQTNISLGVISYLKNDYTKALSYYDNTLNEIFGKPYIRYDMVPTKRDIYQIKDIKFVRRVFNEIYYSYIRLYEKTNRSKYLKKALIYAKLLDYVYDLYLEEVDNNKSKLHWQSAASEFYSSIIESCYYAKNDTLAFYFMEKNKALLLLTNSVEKNIENIDAKFSKQVSSVNYKPIKPITFKDIRLEKVDDLFKKTKGDYSLFLDSIIKYPKIKLEKLNISIMSLEEVQDSILDNASILVSYIWNNMTDDFDALYCMVTNRDSSKIYRIEGLQSFQKSLDKYKNIISKPFTNKKDKEEYQKIAYQLYKKLFPSEEIRELIKGKKLIIIPDGDIQNIPFEALLTEENSSEYLINSSEIIYEYSMSFLRQNKELKRNPKYDFLGFAPVDFEDASLEPLYHSKEEILNIKAMVKGESYFGKDATKDNFLKEVANAKIVHLATHADSDDKIAPWIAFKDEKLYLDELYLTDNQAELVVLSACNTSTGKIISGEGVMSLARGFFYSGTNSVVSSLWTTDDKSTVSVITDFYRGLKEAKTKSLALRKAKLNYIRKHNGSELSPYYWANLILIGNNEPLSLESPDNNLYYFLLFLLLVISGFIYKKYFRK